MPLSRKASSPPKKRAASPKKPASSKKAEASATANDYDFRVFVCGENGGAYAASLTSFFLAEKSQKFNFISMDAGTGYDCLKTAEKNGVLNTILDDKGWKTQPTEGAFANPLNHVGYFRQNQLNGFLITHPHIDHLTGLVIASADEKFMGKKPVITGSDAIAKGVQLALSQPLWPPMFSLGFYESKVVKQRANEALSGIAPKLFADSKIHVRTFPLSHDNSLGESASTAFLLCNGRDASAKACVLFFGDTGPDNAEWRRMRDGIVGQMCDAMKCTPAEKQKEQKNFWRFGREKGGENLPAVFKTSEKLKGKQAEFKKLWLEKTGSALGKDWHPLQDVWDAVRPHMESGALRTVFIESSYLNGKPEFLLFGHLTPALVQKELEYIAGQLKKPCHVSVVVMHIKPTFKKGNTVDSPVKEMTEQFTAVQQQINTGSSKLQVDFIIPKQTDMIYVKAGALTTTSSKASSRNAARMDEMNVNEWMSAAAAGDFELASYDDGYYDAGGYEVESYDGGYYDEYDAVDEMQALPQSNEVESYDGGYYDQYDAVDEMQALPQSEYSYGDYEQNEHSAGFGVVTMVPMFVSLCLLISCVSVVCGFVIAFVATTATNKMKKLVVASDRVEDDHEEVEYDRV
eukprot:CAMPEP_0202731976 /NCGR_PEP_ID=MMETSP1385-20130828/187419_1 /ASSEMBLY_ACC=CAM_ASM_000861 /TAXON_ID=933848 /ORGANISM="Elphidium margaritaceum" /LENGTH=629 /DNA_ID=CAMNT_0049398279 /DNA_START=9 /DNA_END=1899 /DNA_ORIENTATION=-